MSYDHKLSCNFGELIPVHVQEALPGDLLKLDTQVMIRFAPLLAPIMHKVDCFVHHFFVPNRIIYKDWEKFITGGANTGDPVSPSWPTVYVSDTKTVAGTLADYLGVPSFSGGKSANISVLPFAAYQAIYSEYYRDQNLQSEIPYVAVSGSNSDTVFNVLRYRAWQHDYFTGALPFAQKGASVDVPLGDVKLNPNSSDAGIIVDAASHTAVPNSNISSGTSGYLKADTPGLSAVYDPNGSLEVGSTTITDLRRAFKLQEWLEKQARGGTRLIENVLEHFGVRSSDARLNRPEYLGGSRTPVVISEVLQTSSTDATSPQANMSGHGVGVGQGSYNKRYFAEEHGFFMSIMSVMPNTAYFQGLPRMFSRDDRLDYFWPSFQHIGEQAVLNKELYVNHNTPDGVFGYVPRYAEYKYMPSRVSGDFKTTLKYWHLAREFASDPSLNSDFISLNASTQASMNRIFAVTDTNVDHLWCHVFNNVDMVRRMAKYSNPSLL